MSSSRAGGDPGSLDTRGGGASRQRRAAADLGRAGVCGKIQPGANMHTNCLLTGFGGKKFSISTAMTAQKDRSREHRRMIFSALAGDHDAARRHVWGFFGDGGARGGWNRRVVAVSLSISINSIALLDEASRLATLDEALGG